MTTQCAPLRPGNKSLENIVRTDERYGHDGQWLGPRGRDYGRSNYYVARSNLQVLTCSRRI